MMNIIMIWAMLCNNDDDVTSNNDDDGNSDENADDRIKQDNMIRRVRTEYFPNFLLSYLNRIFPNLTLP